MRRCSGLSTVLLFFLSALALPAPAKDAAPETPSLPRLESVLGDLRRGGFVIYFRHGATENSLATDEDSDLSRCDTQRNLSALGREQAVRIGAAFRVLGIPVGSVTSSPFCRCRDTAQLAFGQHSVNPALSFALKTNAEETRKMADALRRMLASVPAPGTNTVLVSHTANLREAAGIWPKPEGTAYVFRPLPGGRFEAVAEVLTADWTAAGKWKHAATPLPRSP